MSITRAEGLRAWAKGLYPTEAAVELLIRALNGRLLNGPWVAATDDPGMYAFATELVDEAGYLSGGEQRVLRIAASLASSTYRISLSDEIPGLDRNTAQLVLAAIAHANGSHEHADIVIDHEAGIAENRGRLASLYPWPTQLRSVPN
jgi:ABC-type transport system involved in cytochrome bd biosynthesis fused ATPase/permease subunit